MTKFVEMVKFSRMVVMMETIRMETDATRIVKCRKDGNAKQKGRTEKALAKK